MLTGRFEWRVPLRGVVHTWQYKGGRPPMDWWGIQYYSRSILLQPNPCLSIAVSSKKTLLMPGALTLMLRAVLLSGHVAPSRHLTQAHVTMCFSLHAGRVILNPVWSHWSQVTDE